VISVGENCPSACINETELTNHQFFIKIQIQRICMQWNLHS